MAQEPPFEVLPPGGTPPRPPQPVRPAPRPGFGWLAAVGLLLLKFGFLLLKALKTVGSMLLMIVLYAMTFGWPYATGFVLLIFVHEMGHVIAARMLGYPVSAPVFIPFVGALITLKENPRDAWTEAWLAYGGPLAGGLGSWICWAAADELQAPWLMAVAASSFVLNLFNLLPVPPLDGGRICAAVSRWFWFVGLLLLGAFLYYFHAGAATLVLVALILIVAFPRLLAALRRDPAAAAYHTLPLARRVTMFLLYVGLAAWLAFGYERASHWLNRL